MKKYSLKRPLPDPEPMFGKRTRAVFEALKERAKTAKEIHISLGRYTLNGVHAALTDLRRAGLLAEDMNGAVRVKVTRTEPLHPGD